MTLLPCLSIRQPWAFSIFHLGKPIENRAWATKYRGPLAIHASLWAPRVQDRAVQEAFDAIRSIVGNIPFERAVMDATRPCGPFFWEALPHGGIIGTVDLVDCVTESDSPWFFGPYGFVLANPRPCKFVPMKGRLGLFNIDANLIEREA